MENEEKVLGNDQISKNLVMTAKEVAGYLKINERTVYTLARRGEIPATKIGKQWRFSRSAIEQMIAQQEAAVSPGFESLS